jgi:hypothetical protein
MPSNIGRPPKTGSSYSLPSRLPTSLRNLRSPGSRLRSLYSLRSLCRLHNPCSLRSHDSRQLQALVLGRAGMFRRFPCRKHRMSPS